MSIWTSEIKELEKFSESLKGQLPDLEKELERLIKADDENMILLYSRRCLEVIITDLCECELKRPRKTEPLQGIIDKLHKEEKVPSHIIASMHGLNELSTYGAHPKDFDPKQVRTTLINLETIIEWYFKYKGINIKREEEVQFKGESLGEVKKEVRIEEQERPTRSSKQKLLSGVLIIAILVMAAIFAYPRIFKKDTLEKLRSTGEKISIAVMPFQNMTNDTTKNVWQDWIQDILITSLSSSEELRVHQAQSVNNILRSEGLTNYSPITTSVAGKISQKLAANIFISGNIKQAGDTIQVSAQLINSKTGEVLKSFPIEGIAENILHIANSLSVMIKDFLITSKLKSENLKLQDLAYNDSPDAYRYFKYGQSAYGKRDYPSAIKMFSKAIAIDSNYTYATLLIAWAYSNQGIYDEAKKWCLKVYSKRNILPIQEELYAEFVHSAFFETPNERITYLKQLLDINDQLQQEYFDLGQAYNALYQYDKAIPAFEKSLEKYKEWKIKPWWVANYTNLGYAYHKTGKYKKEKQLYMKAEQDFPNDELLIYRQAVLALSENKTRVANNYIEKYITIRKENSVPEASIMNSIAGIYSDAGILEKAEEFYRKALSFEPENPDRLNNLAYFLIDKDRNIKEGFELVDKALGSSPDNYSFLHTKGWGLYKQGKYQEALEIIQKSWDLRREKAVYNHEAYLHLEEAKKAVASQKKN
jgi:tetratricopeptide (TPR) repeat protein